MRHLWTLAAISLICFGSADFAIGKSSSGSHSVSVHGYTRKDGTYVAPYTRSSPSHHTASTPTTSAASTPTDSAVKHQSRTLVAIPAPHPTQASTPTPEPEAATPRPTFIQRVLAKFAHPAASPSDATVTVNQPAASDSGVAVKRDSNGRIERSTAAKDAFKRDNPCPATGQSKGGCPGHVIDHITPLKIGGADAPSNMQWQTVEEAKEKDKIECDGHACSARAPR
jgi:hypothetical protein